MPICKKYNFFYRNDADYAIQLDKFHKQKKHSLGFRVQVLRVLMRRYYAAHRDKMNESDFCKNVEATLDNILMKRDYALEDLIDGYRKNVPELKQYILVCPVCSYRPLFCLCDPTSITNELKDFKPDLSLKKEKAQKVLKLTASKEFNAGQKTLFEEMYGERDGTN